MIVETTPQIQSVGSEKPSKGPKSHKFNSQILAQACCLEAMSAVTNAYKLENSFEIKLNNALNKLINRVESHGSGLSQDQLYAFATTLASVESQKYTREAMHKEQISIHHHGVKARKDHKHSHKHHKHSHKHHKHHGHHTHHGHGGKSTGGGTTSGGDDGGATIASFGGGDLKG